MKFIQFLKITISHHPSVIVMILIVHLLRSIFVHICFIRVVYLAIPAISAVANIIHSSIGAAYKHKLASFGPALVPIGMPIYFGGALIDNKVGLGASF